MLRASLFVFSFVISPPLHERLGGEKKHTRKMEDTTCIADGTDKRGEAKRAGGAMGEYSFGSRLWEGRRGCFYVLSLGERRDKRGKNKRARVCGMMCD